MSGISSPGGAVGYWRWRTYPADSNESCGKLAALRKQAKEQDKEIRRFKGENEFLEEANAFFAARRRKSARSRKRCP